MTEAEIQKLLRFMVDAKMMRCQVRVGDRFFLADLTPRADDAGPFPYDIVMHMIPAPIQLAF